MEQFKRSRRREMELGFTLVGPHKDDFTIVLASKEARFFASEGQQRSCMAALRLAEWKRLKTTTEETPLMLIDDIGMSLDSPRRSRLHEYMTSMEQVFMTTTEPFPTLEGSKVIEVKAKQEDSEHVLKENL
jgi:DNA replication and repair protein RecF